MKMQRKGCHPHTQRLLITDGSLCCAYEDLL